MIGKQKNNSSNGVGADDSVRPNNSSSSIQINTIEEVEIKPEVNNKKSSLKKSEIEKVKKILAQEYNISKEKIEINEWKGE